VKYAWMASQTSFTLSQMCHVLDVSKDGAIGLRPDLAQLHAEAAELIRIRRNVQPVGAVLALMKALPIAKTDPVLAGLLHIAEFQHDSLALSLESAVGML
jgi:hypothetical protein